MQSIVTPKYDWRAIVAENIPGPGTDDQRSRMLLLPQVTAGLHDWAVRYEMLLKRVQSSAYTGVVSTKVSPDHYDEAFLVARYVLWIFSLDDYFDRAHLTSDATAPDTFEDELAFVIMSLLELAGPRPAQAPAWGLGWALERDKTATRKVKLACDALGEIYRDLGAVTARFAGAEAGREKLALGNFTLQLAEMIAAWRDELRESSAARRSQGEIVLPSFVDYLRRGAASVAVSCIATVPASFERDPLTAWRMCEVAVQTGGRIARLCNDLANHEAENAEMKTNAMTLALAYLGFRPFGVRDPDSSELARAKQLVQAWLDEEVTYFGPVSAALPDGRLSYWIRVMPAFAIAMYEKGNYVQPV